MKICNLRNKISILQITEFCFVIYIFLFRKLQIFISHIKDFHSFRFANYKKPLEVNSARYL